MRAAVPHRMIRAILGFHEQRSQTHLEGLQDKSMMKEVSDTPPGYDHSVPIKDFANGMREAEERGFTIGSLLRDVGCSRWDSVMSVAAMPSRHAQDAPGLYPADRPLRSPVVMAQTAASSCMSFRRAGSFCAPGLHPKFMPSGTGLRTSRRQPP